MKSLKVLAMAMVAAIGMASDAHATEVVIESNDQLQFSIKEFKVKAGETVKLTLKNVGNFPKNVMGHNVVILKAGVDTNAFAAAAIPEAANDYFPAAKAGEVLAHTKLLAGGESDTIEFTAPAAGKYDFLCTFPGHNAMMRGVMIVE